MPKNTSLPADWPNALERMLRALRDATDLAQDREAAQAHSLPGANETEMRRQRWQAFSARLAKLDEVRSAAKEDIGAVDQVFADAEAAFRRLLVSSEALRGKLAQWQGRAIN